MNQEELLRQNNLRLQKTNVPIRAELARGMATFRSLQDLQVGDVLTMDTEIDEPTVLYVNDEPKFVGKPGRVGRKSAVQITEYIDSEVEELYKNKSKPISDD